MSEPQRDPEKNLLPLQVVSKVPGRGKSAGKVGRPSQTDYAKLVCKMLRASTYQLEECTTLAQMPGVQRRRNEYAAAIFPLGMALRAMFEEAVSEIEVLSHIHHDQQGRRMSTFLKIWYREHGTVVRVAEILGLSRSHVAHHIQRPTLELVARRFLEHAWRSPISA
jgi:hypothetical protein